MVRVFIPGAGGGAGGVTLDVPVPGAVAAPPPSPDQIEALYQSALTSVAMGMHQPAMKALRDLTAQAPNHAAAWRQLAALRRLAGLDKAAAAALEQAARAARHPQPTGRAPDPRTQLEIGQAEERLVQEMHDSPPVDAAAWLRGLLGQRPRAVVPMRMLANLELMNGDAETGRALLERAVEIAPGFLKARADLASLLSITSRHAGALAQTRYLVEAAPGNPMYRAMLADALRAVGDLEGGIAETEALRRSGQSNPKFLSVYAQALHFAGRGAEAARLYREALQADPATAEAYWGLAELRGRLLAADDIAAMRAQLKNPELVPPGRTMMLFALGHALETAGQFEASFAAYSEGAELYRQAAEANGRAHDADAASALVQRRRETFTASSFAIRTGHGDAAAAARHGVTPIFIVGLPRAGSTLVEQILASHSQVEATLELPIIPEIVHALGHSRALVQPDCYPEIVTTLSAAALDELGARYIAQSAAYRRTTRPYFIDKLPSNWRDVGFIRLILPHAKIIDIRRTPMAACFAVYKQYLLSDASYSYSLTDLGRYFTDYAGLMQHWHSLQPGRIHALSYESLVDNSEAEIRALLAYCGLPFEPGCLRFWENDRAVATPSAEQVRRPIFRDAVAQWENYAPWLGELRAALQ